MFERVATRRTWLALAVLVGLTVAATRPRRPEAVWCGGMVERGSIVKAASGVRFTVHHGWDLGAARLAVTYDGVLPDTVCDGADVALEGWMAGDRFHAVNVVGFNNSKYDPCWKWRCRTQAERPSECQRRLQRFE